MIDIADLILFDDENEIENCEKFWYSSFFKLRRSVFFLQQDVSAELG